MKKIKVLEILLFLLIFLAILSLIILKPVNDLDEIWNYNFARNFANGLVPYKDFNMVITPLLSIVCGFILKATINELIIMRILAGILCSATLFFTYEIFNILNINRKMALLFTFFIGYLFKDFFCIDYNFATLFTVLIIIYKEIKLYKRDNLFLKVNKKSDIILGVLAGLCITLKQTSGILIAIVLLGNKLIFLRKKEEVKTYINIFLYRLLGICVPIVMLFIYLLLNDAIYYFIDYTILGVKNFTNIILYSTLFKLNLTGIISVLVPIAIIYAWIKTIIKEKDKNTYILLVYGIAIFIGICFPISNEIHFYIGALPVIIILLNEIDKFVHKFILKYEIMKKIVNYIVTLLISFIILFLVYFIYNKLNFYSKIQCSNQKHYKYIPVNIETEKRISDISDFIKSSDKNTIVLDSSAAIYMITSDKYNKNYDMLNRGNLGKDGEKNIIKEISISNNTQYLVLNDKYILNWQTPLQIIEYVKTNKIKNGEISVFDIYE